MALTLDIWMHFSGTSHDKSNQVWG